MLDPASDVFAALIRAHAYARLPAVAGDERARWAARAVELGRELGIGESPEPARDSIAGLVWRVTLASLERLRPPALEYAPAWLAEPYADRERALLAAYADAHVAVLCALARRRPEDWEAAWEEPG